MLKLLLTHGCECGSRWYISRNRTVPFLGTGTLGAVTGLTGLSFTPTSGATTPQTFDVDLAGSTQYSSPDTVVISNDGYGVGVSYRTKPLIKW